jgi:DNA-3-methyladenine glycosylase
VALIYLEYSMDHGDVLPRSFFARPTVEVARTLLGKELWHGTSAGLIVETEAYLGLDDGAAHAARGITPRTKVIFGPPGHAYVYFIYGMYECLNLVAEPDGLPGCVLIRALQPIAGLEEMMRRRGTEQLEQLANGPGKLTLAMGITRSLNGADVTVGPLVVRSPPDPPIHEIACGTRIGITKAAERPLRFWIKGNRFVSRFSARTLKRDSEIRD